MEVFRLVNEQYDPVQVGAVLIRCSNHSNQKLGAGIYFALTKEDALQFLTAKHDHTYTHLLTCKLNNMDPLDLIDLVSNPLIIQRSEFKSLPYAQQAPAYADKHAKKGVIWKAVSGWTEVCIFEEHVPDCVQIVAAEKLQRGNGYVST